MAQKELLFFMMMYELKRLVELMIKWVKGCYKFVSLFMMMIVFTNNTLANQIPNVSKEDQEWARGLAGKSLQVTMKGMKEKYLELQRMIGVVSDDISNEDGLEELFKPTAVLRVFVSSSMNQQLLKAYVRQAKKYGAVLVFNGLPNGSWRELSELVYNISDQSDNIAIQIDDEAFTRFDIGSVPSFVLSSDYRDNWQELKDGVFDKVTGNVGIRGALTLMIEQGDMSDDALNILERKSN